MFIKLTRSHGQRADQAVFVNPEAIAWMSQRQDDVVYTAISIIGDDPEKPLKVKETPEEIDESAQRSYDAVLPR